MALVYSAATDVAARVAGHTIGAATQPTTTQVEAWLYEAEAQLTGALAAGGITVPITDTNGIYIMRGWACDYAEGHCRSAWAATSGDDNKVGQYQLEKFDKLIADIDADPAKYQGMLWAGAANASTTLIRGSNTDTTATDYIEPEFERDTVY